MVKNVNFLVNKTILKNAIIFFKKFLTYWCGYGIIF